MRNTKHTIVGALESILAKFTEESNKRIGVLMKQLNLRGNYANEDLEALNLDDKRKEKAIKNLIELKACTNTDMKDYQ